MHGCNFLDIPYDLSIEIYGSGKSTDLAPFSYYTCLGFVPKCQIVMVIFLWI
jgi:hypothetical protein